MHDLLLQLSKSSIYSTKPYDYRINGRRGRYGDGISLALAREKLLEAKKRVNAGISPAIEKRNSKTKRKGEKIFHDFTVSYIKHNNGAKPETHQTIVDMAMNGSGCRDTARVLKISLNTVLRHLTTSGSTKR